MAMKERRWAWWLLLGVWCVGSGGCVQENQKVPRVRRQPSQRRAMVGKKKAPVDKKKAPVARVGKVASSKPAARQQRKMRIVRWRRVKRKGIPGPKRRRRRRRPAQKVFGGEKQQMVATAHPLATKEALAVLRRGGNAFDAAVTAAFVLAVVEPYSAGIGGGGFVVLYDARRHAVGSIDFRERAPYLASRTMFSRYGKRGKTLSQLGPLSVGTPGMVAGIGELARRYATLPWKELLAPAHRYAKKGFRVHYLLSRYLRWYRWKMKKFKEISRIFYPGGKRPREGSRLVQKDLAWTIKRLQEKGPEDFYTGEIGKKIVAEMVRMKGLLRQKDLDRYRVYWRAPVKGTYRGYTLYSMGSPSSGGVHLLQMLNILSGFPLGKMKARQAKRLHLVAEAMRLAFADRARYQGDTRFVKVPVRGLLSMKYAQSLRGKISLARAARKGTIKAGNPRPFDRKHTTHLSVVDRWGNSVSMTLTINTTFGSAVVPRGTGIVLNNEMDDFSANPGKPNSYGLVQGEANAIQPGKSPLSCMTPTLMFRDGKLRGALGSPGGPSIITIVALMVLNLVDHGMDASQAIRFPRIHHQWKPAKLYVERPTPSNRAIYHLRKMGHRIKFRRWWGNAMLVWVDEKGRLEGAADPRGDGVAEGF